VPAQQFDAVTAQRPVSLLDFDHRLKAIGEFAKLPEAEALAAANKRIRNILRKVEGAIPSAVDPALLTTGCRQDLADAVAAAIADTDDALKRRDYVAVLGRLARLRPQVDAFFDSVMVNVDDDARAQQPPRAAAAPRRPPRQRRRDRAPLDLAGGCRSLENGGTQMPADPKGACMDARRFPTEPDGESEIPALLITDALLTSTGHFLLVTFLCASKEKYPPQGGSSALTEEREQSAADSYSRQSLLTPPGYPPPMRPAPRLLAAATLCLAAAFPTQAATVTQVDIRGLDEAMTLNVPTSLSLVDAIGKDVSGRRLAYLVREAEAETREALEPFGYYSPTITVERTRSEDTTAPVSVTVTVQLGTPVRVRNADIGIDGDGSDDRYLERELDAFRPNKGDVFDHEVYEAAKARITRRLAERGYFDADFATRKVEVTRADNAADIFLRWDSGERADMGVIGFNQTPKRIIRDSLLDKLVYWEEGEYYHQGRLDRLRKSLVALDYFNRVEIEPHPDQKVDGRVPVTVTLTPAKRDIYTAGLSYGTDSGAGVRLGMERRYVNDRGHKLLGQVDWAEHRKTATVQYRIPAFKYLDGWYTASLQGADEQTDFVDTRRLELVGSRSGEINDRWTRQSRPCTPCASVGVFFPMTRRRRSMRTATPRCCSVAARRIHRCRRPPVPAQRARRHDPAARRHRRRGLRCQLPAAAHQCALVPRPRPTQPLDRARRARPHLHRRTGRDAVEPALLRRRRPQRARLRMARDRAAYHHRRRRVCAGREERRHRQHRVRAVLQRRLGRRGVRRQRHRLQRRSGVAHRRRCRRALALRRWAGAHRHRPRTRRSGIVVHPALQHRGRLMRACL
jgi:hypothetical protein